MVTLAQAPGDNQFIEFTGFFEFSHFQNRIDGFFLSLIDESAGIDNDDIRVFRIGR